MCAHSPATLPHIISLGTVVFRDTALSPYLRELVCLLNAQRLHCEYQWKQHVQIARHASVDEAKIAALAAGNVSGNLWSTEEKALLAFMDEVIGGPEVSETVFAEARKYYSDQTLVEVVTMQVRTRPRRMSLLINVDNAGVLLFSSENCNCVPGGA
jgi:AhpD family alkylhydroperoxidase